jgi:hypothetical protein
VNGIVEHTLSRKAQKKSRQDLAGHEIPQRIGGKSRFGVSKFHSKRPLSDRMDQKSNPSRLGKWRQVPDSREINGAPGGFELPTFWFVGKQSKILSAAFGVAYGGTRHLSRP